MFFKKFTKEKGFTLIELLVVIAIIAVLTTIVIALLNNAKSKTRDTKRIQDMKQLKTAIELFYSQNGYYPTCSGGNIHCDTTGAYGPLNTLEVVPTYLAEIKNDPQNTGGYGYYYARGYIKTGTNSFTTTSTVTDYILGMRLENSSAPTYTGWSNPNLNYLDSNVTP